MLLSRRIREVGRARVKDRDDVAKDRPVAVLKPIDEAGSLIIALVVVDAMPPGRRDLGGEYKF